MALNLTRHVGESITIGKDVVITVIEMHGGQVRLAITAPPEIHVVRSELLERDKFSLNPRTRGW